LNSNILVGPRALFAVGRDMRRLAWLERIDPRTGTPAIAILALCGWSIALIFLADWVPTGDKRLFDLLTDYCVFGGSVFYFTAVLAVFVLRRTRPDADRPYRTWAYPIVPIVFVVFYVFLLATMLVGTPWASLGGLAFIFAGLPIFAVLNFPPREGDG
jgi:APA family basic amino acid/polyamine antiporter